jgi:hypothetical protein
MSAGAAEKSFNQIRAAFMRRASAPNIPHAVFKLSWLLAYRYMNNETRTARPSQTSLAADLNVSIRTVQRLLDILQPLGLVIVAASTYWIEPEPDKATPMSPINTTPMSPIEGQKATSSDREHDIQRQNRRQSFVAPTKKKNLEEELREERLPRAGAREGENATDLDLAFEDFFRQWCPERQTGKEAARRLYKRLVRTGLATVPQLNGGAMRYGAACEGRELRYIATPLNYLKDGNFDGQYASASSRPMGYVETAAALYPQRGRRDP